MASYTKESKSSAIKNEQQAYQKFHSMIKTMDSIVYFGYGGTDEHSRNVSIYTESLCLLNYFLWKAFIEVNDPRINYRPIHLMLPLLRDPRPATKKTKFNSYEFDLFKDFYPKKATTISKLHTELSKALSGWGRAKEKDKDSVLYTELDKTFDKCLNTDITSTIGILNAGAAGYLAENANRKLAVVIIITALFCRATSDIEQDPSSYDKELEILLRLALVLDGENIVGETKTLYPDYKDRIQKIHDAYGSLIDDSQTYSQKVRNIMSFVFGLDYSNQEDAIKLLIIEKELFRIARRLCNLAQPPAKKEEDDNASANNNGAEDSALGKLRQYVRQKNKEDKIPKLKRLSQKLFESTMPSNTVLGVDEENFYYILKQIC